MESNVAFPLTCFMLSKNILRFNEWLTSGNTHRRSHHAQLHIGFNEILLMNFVVLPTPSHLNVKFVTVVISVQNKTSISKN
jgi:hypothetical protein